jgi:Domain of unknown function (DUF4190)/Septum formation
MTQPPGQDPQGYPPAAYPPPDQPAYPQAYPPPDQPAYPQPYPPSYQPGVEPSYQQGVEQAAYPGVQMFPPQGYPPTPAPRRGTDGFAIASLVFGIIGGVLLSVIFGLVALRRIRRNATSGRGLAIAGLVLSGLWVLGVGALVAFAVATGAGRDANGSVTDPGREKAANVRLGDCIETWPKDGLVINLQVTPCTSAHEAEVFAVDQLPAGSYPGVAAVKAQTEALCTRHAELLKPSELAGLNLGYLFPESTNWARGDRKVSCIALSKNGSRTSSVRR